MSYLIRGVAAQGEIRIIGADTTDLVADACFRHQTSQTAGAALGRSLTGALLLCHVLLKNNRDRIMLRLLGDGPLGGVIADAGLDGVVRGYVNNPGVELRPREDGKLDVGGGVGKIGEIEVIRSHAPYGEPYSSSVNLTSGEVAEDITSFLGMSEQIFSAVLLGVRFGEKGVENAGGVLVQVLPGAKVKTIEQIEQNLLSFGQLTDALRSSKMFEILYQITRGLGLDMVTKQALPLSFKCRCSEAKALDALAYFPLEERQLMISEDGGAEVSCHWCGEVRWLTSEIIESISGEEIRCPECRALWYREGQSTMIRDNEMCACGRKVILMS